MGDRLRGRAALVTGAGNGIGKAIASLLATEGASVVVNDLGTDEQGRGTTRDAADAAVAAIIAAGGVAVASYDSVASPDGCARAVQTAIDAFGACDIAVANAGALLDSSATGLATGDESWQRLCDLYLGQKFWLSRAAVPAMLARGWGRVLFATSEIARGKQANPLGAAVFSGGIGLARDLAYQHRNSGVTFNCYAPGAATRLFDVYRSEIDEGMRARGIPADEWSKHYLPPPECVAPMVAWLCSEAAGGVTGEVFNIAGGTVARWSHLTVIGSLVKDGDERGLWSLDELDALVPSRLLAKNT